MFPAVRPADSRKPHSLFEDERAKLIALETARPRAWYEDPLAIGTLLIMCPPIGLAVVWSSKRYSSDARWALTVMTALMMCLASAIVITILALQR
jgi:hypothetical protein